MSEHDFGQQLRQLRHARSETLEDVSKATGLSVAMLSRVERGERLPSPESVEALAQHFALPADELMSETIAHKVMNRYGREWSGRPAERAWAAEPAMSLDASADECLMASAPAPVSSRARPPLPTRTAGTAFVAQPIEALFGENAARDQLADAARVADVALESAMRAVRRALASQDPDQVEEAERVLERLRDALR